MTAPFLALDCEQCAVTGTLTLYLKSGQSFAFASVEALRAFCAYYYRNPIAACFAYHALQERERRTV